MSKFKLIRSVSLRVAISLLLLFFIFGKVDRKSLFEIIRNSDKGLLFLVFCSFIIIYILCFYRWVMLLNAFKIHLPLRRVFISYCAGLFFNLFLPSSIGGDFMRSVDLATHTKKPKEIIATVLLDRISGYAGLVLMALFALMIGWKFVQDKTVLLSVGIITVVLIAVLLALFNQFLYSKINKLLYSPNSGKIRDLLTNLHREMYYLRDHQKLLFKNLGLSFIIQAINPVSFFIIALSLGIEIRAIYFFVFLPLITAITFLPISIGGLGLRDATTVFFFAKAGVSHYLAFAMSLLGFFFILLCGIIGGLVYVLTLRHRRIQCNQTPRIHKS